MVLHNLSPAKGSKHTKKRKGRGQGSGKGGTATKGHKGAQSRSGYKTKPHFEGGQTPLQRRTPKSYFKRNKKDAAATLKTSALAKLAQEANTADLTQEILIQHGLVRKGKRYKVLSDTPLDQKINVATFACSGAARKNIEAHGGKITIIQK